MPELVGAAGPTDQPSDNTTLTEVLDGYRSAGFAGSLWSIEGALVGCENCGSELPAGSLAIQSLRRLEGASDPADEMVVIATTCAACSSRGVLVLAYGPMASANDLDVLSAMQDQRGDGSLPPDSSPAESPAPDTSPSG